MDKVRLGLIGCGNMGGVHERGMDSLLSRMTVAATCDTDEARANEAAKLLGAEVAATDYREILHHVDAVVIALPHHLHHEVGMTCLKAGVHVLMEKPLANSEAECLDLIRTADAAGRVLMVGYIQRFNPLVLKVKELLDAKAYGDVFQISIWTEQYTHRGDGSWHHRADTLGGGQLFSHGCHYIDLLLWMLGRPVSGTHVGTNFGTPWMEKEGTSNVSMTFESGALGYHFGTWGTHRSRLQYSIHAHCTGGMIDARLSEGVIVAYTKDGEEVLFESATDKRAGDELGHFLDCIQHGERPVTDGPGSLQGLRVIWRLYEAEQRGVVADLRGLGLEELP